MITIGVDAHKRIHVALALDEAGREIGEWRGPNSQAGWRDLSLWAFGLGGERQWGIEGAWGYGRCLAQHLVERGEAVYEINPRWTAAGRQRARKPGKTDRLDARAVALFVRQEAPLLPVVQLEDDSAILELLSTERDQVLAEIVRIRNQIHALLTHIDPEYQSRLPALKSRSGLAVLEAYDAPGHHPVQLERVAGVRRLARRLALAVAQLDLVCLCLKSGQSRAHLVRPGHQTRKVVCPGFVAQYGCDDTGEILCRSYLDAGQHCSGRVIDCSGYPCITGLAERRRD